jgi:hypothetical protein
MPAFLEIALEIRSLFMVPTGSEAKDLMGLALRCAAEAAICMG